MNIASMRIGICATPLILAVFAPHCEAKPEVEGYELVRTERAGRTVFDYSYRIRVIGDGNNYSDGRVVVSLRSVVPGMTLTKSTVSVGRVDAGAFVRPPDTFTVRVDRTQRSNMSALKFDFEGPQAVGNGVNSAVEIGPVQFVQNGGGRGHGGAFAIQGQDPEAGSLVGLFATILDPVTSVTYRLVSSAGGLVAQGSLLPAPGETVRYVAALTIPAQPFTTEITAINASGAVTLWTSPRTYNPAPFRVTFPAPTNSVSPSQTFPFELVIDAVGVAGTYGVAVFPPAGFSASQTQWQVNLVPGVPTSLTTSMTASPQAESFKEQSVVVQVTSSTNPSAAYVYRRKVMVKL